MMNHYDFATNGWIVSHSSNDASLYFYGTNDNGGWNSVAHDANAALIGTHVYRTDS